MASSADKFWTSSSGLPGRRVRSGNHRAHAVSPGPSSQRHQSSLQVLAIAVIGAPEPTPVRMRGHAKELERGAPKAILISAGPNTMKTLWSRALLSVLTGWCVLLNACQQQQAAPPPPPPKVTVRQPVVRDVVEWGEYTVRLEAVESVDIRPRVSGYLQSVHFTDGAIVKKGALLFVIDPRPYQAELNRTKATLEQAIARHERTQKDYTRAQQLVKSRAISEEEVDTRAADQREARESVQAGRAAVETARVNVEFTPVRGPISGRISREFVTEGNLINGGTADSTLLTRIVSLDPIYCYFDVDERSYLKYTRLWRDGKRSS